jgi:hypothetical protein
VPVQLAGEFDRVLHLPDAQRPVGGRLEHRHEIGDRGAEVVAGEPARDRCLQIGSPPEIGAGMIGRTRVRGAGVAPTRMNRARAAGLISEWNA